MLVAPCPARAQQDRHCRIACVFLGVPCPQRRLPLVFLWCPGAAAAEHDPGLDSWMTSFFKRCALNEGMKPMAQFERRSAGFKLFRPH